MRAALTLLALLCSLTGARAVEVTVGANSLSTDANFPVSSQFQFSYTQQIFTLEEIGTEGYINSVTLWLGKYNDFPDIRLDIYMKEVDKDEFAGKEDWVPMSVDDKVYTGTLSVANTTEEAYTFKLDKPFKYNHTGNLLIAFNKLTTNYSNDDGLKGRVFYGNEIRTLRAYRDNIGAYNPADPTFRASVEDNKRNVVKFEILPALPVMVGDVDNASGDYFPLYSYYNQSYTQQIYTPEELEMSGAISSVTLWLKGSSSMEEMTFDIYMAETDKASFTSNTDWLPLNAADIVYSGKQTFSQSTYQPYTFELDLPFLYSGKGNLLIAFHKKTGKSSSSSYLLAKSFNSADQVNRCIQDYNTSASYEYNLSNPTFYAYKTGSWRNVMRFDFKPCTVVADKPATLTVADVTYKSAKLSWSGGTGTYNVEYKLKDATEWEHFDKVSYTSKNLTNLAEHSVYQVRVQSVAADGSVSGWKTAQVVTPYHYPAPTDITCTALTATTATLSWKENGTATAWYISVAAQDDYPGEEAYTNPFTLSGLDEEASYTIRIRALDDNDGATVNWSEPFTFEPTSKHVIGFGSDTSSHLPTSTESSYSLSEQLYTKEELGEAGNILSIDFFSNATERTRNLDIYMVSTDKSYFDSSNTHFIVASRSNEKSSTGIKSYIDGSVPVSFENLVFSGEVTFLQNAWTTITLDTPFEYDGQSNVVIVVDDNTKNYSYRPSFRTFKTQDAQAIYDTFISNYDPTSSSNYYSFSRLTVKNQIRLAKGDLPVVLKPTQLTVRDITPTTAKLSWTSDAQSFNVRWGTDATLTEWTGSADNVGKPYLLTGLEPETTYYVQVQACHPQKGNSAWTTTKLTTIPMLTPPHSLHITAMTKNSATMGWTGYQDTYKVKLTAPEHPVKSAFTQLGSNVEVTEELKEYSFDLSGYTGLGTVAIRYLKCNADVFLYVDDVSLYNSLGVQLWKQDFESGSMPEGWKQMRDDGEIYAWRIGEGSSCHGSYHAYSQSGGGYEFDNWLIIPDVMLGGTLKLYANCSLRSWAVGEEKPTPTAEFGVFVSQADDVTVPGYTSEKANVQSPYTFENLEQEVLYWAQVMGISSTAGNTTEWSDEYPVIIPTYLMGDVNGDFKITPADAIMVLYSYFGVEQNGFISKAADVNFDGKVTPADAIEILYYYFSLGSGDAMFYMSREKAPAAVDDLQPE